MKSSLPVFLLSLTAVFGGLSGPVLCQEAPIQAALAESSEAERVFNGHVQFLAHPFLEGRLPGTRGMEIARDYIEQHFRDAGLEPAFGGNGEGEGIAAGADSYRQPFQIGRSRTVTGQMLDGAAFGEELQAGLHYRASPHGEGGEVTAPVVFAGYGVSNARRYDYASFQEGDSLKGKIALIFRFEPMTKEGTSRFVDRSWSRAASLRSKLRGLRDLNPAGVIIANPPGCADPRSETLADLEGTGRRYIEVPVLHVTTGTARMLAEAAGKNLLDMRKAADEGRTIVDLGLEVKMGTSIEIEGQGAENVGGLLRGRGDLADELVIVGAHIDHLGMGRFGSRDREWRGKRVHPGADDNASGAAAIMMMAETLVKAYEELPADAAARTVLFIGFDAEEQGLLGARHYLTDPLVPHDQHALMINFDMIGRLTEGKISVQGLDSAEGLEALLAPAMEASELEVVKQRVIPASDHYPFYRAEIPILFSICHSLTDHPDYHTSRDTAWRINVRDGVKAVRLYDDFLYRVATHPQGFSFSK